jgi:hypothetical protein
MHTTDNILFFSIHSDNLALYWIPQLLMERRSYNTCPMNPRASQQAGIGRTNVHYVKDSVEDLRSYLDRENHFTMDNTLRTIVSTHHNVTRLQFNAFTVELIEYSFR